jgi:mannose/fructose-specific phosphotransferase system component IIA
MTVSDILEQRGSRYGSFADNARDTQLVYALFTHAEMPKEIKEAIHMICHKLARVRHGDCMHDDNFVDIAGYATLAAEWIKERNESA